MNVLIGMSKTITLENPITKIGRFFARRSILKMQKKIAKLEAKYFNEEASENTTKQEETKTEKVSTLGKTIFFKQEKFDFQKVEEILDLEIEEYQSFGMKKHGDIGIKAKGKSDNLAKKVNQKKRALKKYGLHLEPFEKSLNKGAVIN
jgi:hypothetical protein